MNASKKEEDYQKIIDDLENGDLLLFKGKNGGSKIVKTFTASDFTHVSIVWVCPITKKKYSWESTTANNVLHITQPQKEIYAGTRLTPLLPKLKAYQGKVFVRKLKKPSTLSPRWDLFYDFYIANNLGRKYPDTSTSTWTANTKIFPLLMDPLSEKTWYEDVIEYKTLYFLKRVLYRKIKKKEKVAIHQSNTINEIEKQSIDKTSDQSQNRFPLKLKKDEEISLFKVPRNKIEIFLYYRNQTWICTQSVFWTYVFLGVMTTQTQKIPSFGIWPVFFARHKYLHSCCTKDFSFGPILRVH